MLPHTWFLCAPPLPPAIRAACCSCPSRIVPASHGRIACRKKAGRYPACIGPRAKSANPHEDAYKHDREVNDQVQSALDTLAAAHEDGVYPEALANQIAVTGVHVRATEVRQALRRLQRTGQVRRVARGKFLPAHPPEGFIAADAAQ